MKTKTMKILTVIVTGLLLISMMMPVVYGLTPASITPATNISTTDLETVGSRILGALQAIGMVLAVVIIAVLGIKYMMGSAEEKAEYKKSMVPYLVGAALIFLSTTIANAVYNFFNM